MRFGWSGHTVFRSGPVWPDNLMADLAVMLRVVCEVGMGVPDWVVDIGAR
ncbi:hypothetical protein [Nocardia iowensis]